MLHHVASRFCPCFGSLYEASGLAAGPPEAIKEQESKADAAQPALRTLEDSLSLRGPSL